MLKASIPIAIIVLQLMAASPAAADGPVTVIVARGYVTFSFSLSSLDACRRFLSEYAEPGMCVDNQSGEILERWACGRTFEGKASCKPLAPKQQ